MTLVTELDEQRTGWVDAAVARLSDERLTELVASMVAVPSPTGEEGPLAAHLVADMGRAGIDARVQPVDDHQANAVGRVVGDGTGADLLLYAPIDTLTVGDDTEDLPWIGPALRPDMRPEPSIDGPFVVGLGAGNPKGHGACIVAAAQALVEAAVPLRGDVVLGFGAGGMPTNRRPVTDLARHNIGQGVGCSFMLEQGVWADAAVIAKPGWAVSHEEVGLCWFDVRVHGTHTYVGSRHLLPYRNPVVAVVPVIEGLERWAAAYSASHTDGLVAPQVNIGAIEGGWTRMPAVSSAVVRLLVDVRVSPRTSPMQVKREVGEALRAICNDHPDLELTWDMTVAIPGTTTPSDHWVVGSAVRAWEAVEGRAHQPVAGTSGATDANILRNRGIPTARVGMPKATDAPFELDFAMGMNTVDVRWMRRLSELLIRVAVDTCTRPLDELGARA